MENENKEDNKLNKSNEVKPRIPSKQERMRMSARFDEDGFKESDITLKDLDEAGQGVKKWKQDYKDYYDDVKLGKRKMDW